MNRKLYIIILCILMLTTNIVYSEGEEITIEPIDLGSPKYLSLEIEEDKFLLGWKNPTEIFTKKNIEYQVDFKFGRGEWISNSRELPTDYLSFSLDGKSSIIIDPKIEGILSDDINLEETSYSFRVRYRYGYIKDGVQTYVNGYCSSPVTLGLQSYYQNASDWAFEELDKAVEYNMIPDEIRDDMKKNITREEFSEVAVKLYELHAEETVNYEGETFKDTTNPEVLKASKLGIVKGVGEGNFAPTSPVTRQEIAVMLNRTLALLYPKMDFSYGKNLPPTTESNIAEWAIKEVNFMRDQGILKGNDQGLINPIGLTTREQAVILTLRTHEQFK